MIAPLLLKCATVVADTSLRKRPRAPRERRHFGSADGPPVKAIIQCVQEASTKPRRCESALLVHGGGLAPRGGVRLLRR
jgi:hypothetical protein